MLYTLYEIEEEDESMENVDIIETIEKGQGLELVVQKEAEAEMTNMCNQVEKETGMINDEETDMELELMLTEDVCQNNKETHSNENNPQIETEEELYEIIMLI